MRSALRKEGEKLNNSDTDLKRRSRKQISKATALRKTKKKQLKKIRGTNEIEVGHFKGHSTKERQQIIEN